MGQPAAVGFDARARECGAHRRCFDGRGLQHHSGSPPLRRWQYCIPPRVDAPGTPYRLQPREWWDHRPLDGSTASHPPVCLRQRGQRAAARRPSSRVAARTQTTAIASDTPPRIECTVASLVEGSSLLDAKALLVDGAVEDETVGPTSAENSLARALGSPQRPSPAVGLCAR